MKLYNHETQHFLGSNVKEECSADIGISVLKEGMVQK